MGRDPGTAAAEREELRGRSVRSGLLQLTSQAGQLVLMVVSGAVLARLLTPSDFGLMAMVTAVTGLVEAIRHFGIPQAAVQHDEFSDAQASALFWRALQLTALVVGGMVAATPLVALFYREPRLVGIMLVIAATFAIRGLTLVHEGVLMRRLRFGGLVVADLLAWTIAVALGIWLAWAGWGYWALVAQAVALAVVRTAAIWWGVDWRPSRRAAGEPPPDTVSLFAYGSDVTRYQILAYAAHNVDRVLIGFARGAQPLGYYDAAYRWSRYPINQIANPLSGVVLAGLSRVRHDREAYRRSARTGLLPLFSVILPALVFFALEAERTILLLLGDQWGPAVPIFRVLCVAGIAATVIRIAKWLFLVEGNTALQVGWGLVYFPVMALATAAGLPWGAMGVAWGFAAGNWVMMPSAVSTAIRDSSLRSRDIYAVAARPAGAALAAAVPTLVVATLWPGAVEGVEGGIVLLRQGAVFTVSLLAAWLAIPGGRARLAEVVDLLGAAVRRPPRGSPLPPELP